MTVGEAISASSGIYPSELDGTSDYAYLSEIESRIRSELFSDNEEVIFTDSDEDEQLSAGGVHSCIYPIYIASRRELAVGDAEGYAFLNSVFEKMYSDYANYENRRSAAKRSVNYIKTV